jgi:hypothetical protein
VELEVEGGRRKEGRGRREEGGREEGGGRREEREGVKHTLNSSIKSSKFGKNHF